VLPYCFLCFIKHDSMENMILTPISIDTLIEKIREVVKAEIKSDKQNELAEKLLSPAEACKIFQPGIGASTLSRWTNAGHITAIRIGGKVFYKYSSLIEAGKSLKRYKNKL
jgi:hypothetical protein